MRAAPQNKDPTWTSKYTTFFLAYLIVYKEDIRHEVRLLGILERGRVWGPWLSHDCYSGYSTLPDPKYPKHWEL